MKKLLLYLIAFGMFAGTAFGWEDNVTKNTQVTPTGLNYLENEVKTNKNGITYVFMICGGNPISMRLQIVDTNGQRVLSRGGQLISQEANRTWVGFNQYIELDKDGNAFIGVQDYRKDIENKKLTYTIYKYNEQGEKLMDGVTLNDGIGYGSATGLTMCATDDGGCVCAYQYTDEEKAADFIIVEKIGSDGKSLWKKTIYQADRFSFPYPFLTNAADGRILALITTGGEMKKQIISPNGTLEFETPETVYTKGFASQKIWEVFNIREMPGYKTVLSIVNGNFRGTLMVIEGDGTIGLDGSMTGIQMGNDGYAADAPAVTYNAKDDTYMCFYKIFDRRNTSNCSLWLRKINANNGSDVWDSPKEMLAFQQDFEYGFYSMKDAGNGQSALFFMKKDAERYDDVKAYAQIIGSDGSTAKEAVPFATALSNKQNLRVSDLVGGQFFAAWDDKRNSQMSLFMQNIRLDDISSMESLEEENIEKEYDKVEYFSINGIKIDGPQKGINIVRYTKNNKVKTVKIIR